MYILPEKKQNKKHCILITVEKKYYTPYSIQQTNVLYTIFQIFYTFLKIYKEFHINNISLCV